ncbi:hypothetical protein [Actinophytocola sp.]|uniref:hypothetical protein n=1 Tax=Actinophytocola sp. TaxID=1872138 RepID=UPI002D7ED850|nr:hypothetical protein [Actinophytocola sp.]HET9140450.1 hypothetical protein [Actinophytocola sp.]
MVAVVVLALVAWFVQQQMRRRQLRERFGPEYDRAIEEGKDRREVESELLERQKRHSQLDIRPLDEAARTRHIEEWERVQADFVDDPGSAVAEADRLVTVVMSERGYPTEGFEQQVADLSVRHATTLNHYRDAHEVMERHSVNQASTEDLREAMVHYRALFEELLASESDDHRADTAHRRA